MCRVNDFPSILENKTFILSKALYILIYQQRSPTLVLRLTGSAVFGRSEIAAPSFVLEF